MKKSTTLFLSAIALFTAISCAKEVEIINEQPTGEQSVVIKTPMVIVANTDDDIITKTSLDGVNVIWATSDVIMGYDGSGKYSSSSTAIAEGGKTATFTFSALSIEDDLYYLIYPADAVGDADMSTATITIPTTQTATEGSFANGANIAWAEGGVADEAVSFKNIGGLISIIINNDNISSVEIMANEVMTGAGSLDVSTGEATPGAGSNSVILDGGLTNGSEYYAVVYPGTYTGLKIIITKNDGKKAVFTNPNPITVARNSNTHIATLTASNWYTVVNNTIEWNETTDWSGSGAVLTLSDGNFEIELDKTSSGGTNPAINADALDARVYANGEVTITNSSDRMTSIVFNISTQGKKRLAPITANVGTIKTQASGDVTVEWTGVAKEVVFSVGAKANYGSDGSDKAGQLCFDSIDIKTLDDGKTSQTLSFPQAAYSIVYGNSFAAPTVSGANTTVTYSSSDTSIAEVNSSTGAVTINTSSNYGTVRITAKAASDATYRSATAYYELTVEEPIVLTYYVNGTPTNRNGYVGQDLDELLPVSPSCGISGYQFDGWSESIVATTDTKPTYTSKTELPAGGLTLYAVFVKVTSTLVPASTATYNKDDFSHRGSSGSGSEINYQEGGVTFNLSLGYEYYKSGNPNHLKAYAGCVLTFTSSRNITSVVINANNNNITGDDFVWSSNTGTWSGTAATTVTLTNTAAAQSQISSIAVSLEAGSEYSYSGYTTSPVAP